MTQEDKMMYYYGPGMAGWAMALMIFANVVFWTVLVLGALLVARALRRGSPSFSPRSQVTPKQLLAERFAQGEITEEEYLHRLAVLSEGS
jgi:putative membrane protein